MTIKDKISIAFVFTPHAYNTFFKPFLILHCTDHLLCEMKWEFLNDYAV